MIPVTTARDQRIALFGLGGSGLVTAQALVAGGADVTVWDDAPAARQQAEALGLTVRDLAGAEWRSYSLLVLAPGVPLTHPEPHWIVKLARDAGTPIIGDIELFARERRAVAPACPFIAITGTNGKSTTTALVAHLLRSAGRDVELGGNIGTAVLALQPFAEGRHYVVECSSFQIDLAPSLDPSVGIMLNVTPDHLDRHGTIEAYAAIKERLIARAGYVICGIDDIHSAAMARRTIEGMDGAQISILTRPTFGYFAEGQKIFWCLATETKEVADLAGIPSLRGAHNAQNAAAAIAAAFELGLTQEEIAVGLASFPGLPHRMEQVGRVGPVLFVNDSKATNADSAEKALLSFEGIHWILGGKPKEGGIAPLAPLFAGVERAYLIGSAAEAFAATLGDAVPHEICGTLEIAVARAAAQAALSTALEPVVLLSPAAASYDQFRNFEVRGDAFRALVQALPGFTPLATGA
jgi:UDP-N-acetylmuramoylalanine--D-glutamate ligase